MKLLGMQQNGVEARALENLQLLTDRLAPESDVWGIFPGDGGFEPIAAGRTFVDLSAPLVNAPNGNITLDIPQTILTKAQSLVIVVDTLVHVNVMPGLGSFPTAGAVIEGPVRRTTGIQLDADTPYNLLLAFGTAYDIARVRAVQLFQIRVSDTTLTKSAGAGTEDSLTNLAFVPATRAITQVRQLNQADFGVNYIRVPGWGTKTYLIRNLGAGDAEVQLFGTVSVTTAGAIRWIADPDTGGARLTIPSGDDLILETGIQYGAVQLRAAVARGVAAGVTARLVVEYIAVAPGVR